MSGRKSVVAWQILGSRLHSTREIFPRNFPAFQRNVAVFFEARLVSCCNVCTLPKVVERERASLRWLWRRYPRRRSRHVFSGPVTLQTPFPPPLLPLLPFFKNRCWCYQGRPSFYTLPSPNLQLRATKEPLITSQREKYRQPCRWSTNLPLTLFGERPTGERHRYNQSADHAETNSHEAAMPAAAEKRDIVTVGNGRDRLEKIIDHDCQECILFLHSFPFSVDSRGAVFHIRTGKNNLSLLLLRTVLSFRIDHCDRVLLCGGASFLRLSVYVVDFRSKGPVPGFSGEANANLFLRE